MASMQTDNKRLFFALEVTAPWPQNLPQGRCLLERDRHLTLAFLGNTDFPKLQAALSTFPTPPFAIGLTGIFDSCLLLPERQPHVVAWHVDWWDNSLILNQYQVELIHWLARCGISCDTKRQSFLPHVTLCRQPFNGKEWMQAFHPLPMAISQIHLYESLGHSHYQSIWSFPILAPFSEIEHTADIAFHIRGHTFNDLHIHAQIALAFKSPSLLPYLSPMSAPIENIEEIIIDLNMRIGKADAEIGSPFKAISFHDKMQKKDNLFIWEMIVDV